MKKRLSSVLRGIFVGAVSLTFGLAALDAGASLAKPQNPTQTATARHQVTGQPITYQIRDGLAILGGDIAVGTHAKVQAEGIRPWTPKWRLGGSPSDTSGAAVITGGASFWTSNTLYYSFDPGLSSAAKAAFLAGSQIISSKSSVKFVQRTTQQNYVNVIAGGGCYSYLGMVGGRQELSLGMGCEIAGIAAHEIMHALGFQHEHQRPDRDAYITVLFDNVDMNYWSQLTAMQDSESRLVTPYDYDSVMHYPTWAFSSNGQPTIVPKNGVDPERLGKLVYYEPYGLSAGDVSALGTIYGGGPVADAWESKKQYKHGDVVSYRDVKYTLYVIDTGTGLQSMLNLKGLKPSKIRLSTPKFGNAYMAFWLTDSETFFNGQLAMGSKCTEKLSVSSKFSLLIAGTSLGLAASNANADSVVALQSGSKIQKWKAVANGDGYYQILNDATGFALGATGTTAGSSVLARNSKTESTQQWCPLKRGDNYELRNRGSGLPAALTVTRVNEALKLSGNAAVFEFKK